MTSWPAFGVRRARAAWALLAMLLALVVVTTAIIAGSVGYASTLATRAAQAALEDPSAGEAGLTVRARLGDDPEAQDALARARLAAGFEPAPVVIETSYLSSAGEPIGRDDASAQAESFVQWSVLPDVARITPGELGTLADGAERARSMVADADTQGRGITVSGDLAATAARAAQDRALNDGFRFVPLSVLLLVAVVGLVQVATLLAASRDKELALLYARGASLRQALTLAVAESLAVATAGAALGTALALGVVAALSGGGAHSGTVLGSGFGAWAISAAALTAVAVRAAVRAARGSRSGADRVRAVAGAASFVLVAALAALATWQLRRAGSYLTTDDQGRVSTDVVAALAPALLIALAALASLVVLAPLTRLLELATRRLRGVSAWLACAQLARGLRLYAVPVVLAVLATGTATFASLFAGTSSAMARDLDVLARGADVRVAVGEASASDPLAPLAEVPGATASAPVWFAPGAQVGDLVLPALAAPTPALAEVATLPPGVAVPDLTVPAPSQGPRPLALPAGASSLRVDLATRSFLDGWQQAAFDLIPQRAAAQAAADGVPEQADEAAHAELDALAVAATVTVSLQLRDADTGQSARLEVPALELPAPGITLDEAGPAFAGSDAARSVDLPLPAGRALVVDSVRITTGGGAPLAWSMETTLGLGVDGVALFGEDTADWIGDGAVTASLDAPYREALAAAGPPTATLSTTQEEGETSVGIVAEAPPQPSAVLDVASAPWRLTSGVPDAAITVGPYVAFGSGTANDPLGAMSATNPPTRPTVRVAITAATARDTTLEVGDALELNAFQNRIPAEVGAIVEAVPSVTGEHALLLDSGALGAALAGMSTPLGPPAQVWAATDDPPPAQSDPTQSAAAQSLWVAAVSALLLAVTGLAAATSSQLGARRPEVAVLRALGMTPASQAASRRLEVAGVLALASAAGLACGWGVGLLVGGQVARAATRGTLPFPTPVSAHWPPLLALLLLGAVAVSAIVFLLGAAVRRQAGDAEYREEVR